MNKIKQNLALIFDDNLKTVKWKNIVDYTIIGLIVLSTVEIFLSTYDQIVAQYSFWLDLVDYFTIAVFTIEVTLRIWCADMLDEKYKGFKGRIRYCLSFYGLVDVLSTYTFYLALIFPIPYMAFKVLRVMRLVRIFRYIKAFNILSRAISSKKNELLVSLEFLIIVTLMLSFVLYFIEHDAQPEVYENGWISVLWAFMQYVGDPGSFADTPPITALGHAIAVIIGLLGIAIFAVPAGLIGSAFSEVMEEDQKKDACKEWQEKLHNVFERKLDRITRYQIVPRYISVADIQALQNLKLDEIMDAIDASDDCRLINLASTKPLGELADDKLAVEVFPVNRTYGCCIDRGSKVTIVNPSGCVDAINNWASFYLAKLGGFNYISRSKGGGRPYKSYYMIDSEESVVGLKEYMDDLRKLAPAEDCWLIPFLAASGSQEPAYPTDIHWTYGAKLGDSTYNDPNITLNDVAAFDNMQKAMAEMLNGEYGIKMDCQQYHDNASPKLFVRKWAYKPNMVSLRMAWSIMCWDSRTIQMLESMAKVINQYFEPGVQKQSPANIKTKAIAYDDEL